MMNYTKIPLVETGYFEGLIKLYLKDDSRLKPFYNFPNKMESIADAVSHRKQFEINRPLISKVLLSQHQKFLTQFPSIENNIELIKDKNTFTVTTGHQICLATGPLYFIYKIASAIHCTKKLKIQYPDYNFVPLYWMATEDHDFEEINHINLFHKKVIWNKEVTGATGRISTDGIDSFLAEIKDILGAQSSDNSVLDIIEQAYKNNSNLADATREIVIQLFGNYGLLVLDADHRDLKTTFKGIIKNDIFNQVSFKSVNKTIEDLISAQVIKEDKIQVKPRPINFFYLKDNLRKRIVFENNHYSVIDTAISFTLAELENEIDQFPERFSPNVIMRPLYQELLLPNLSYIGGAGEISYWLELKAVFDAHQVFFPILALRTSLLFIDHKQYEKLSSLGFQIKDVLLSSDALIQRFLESVSFHQPDFNKYKTEISDSFKKLQSEIGSIDLTLSASVEAELQKAIKSIDILDAKAVKALKNKHEVSVNQLKKLKESLFPGGSLQERYDTILWLNLKYGHELINDLVEVADAEINHMFLVNIPH